MVIIEGTPPFWGVLGQGRYSSENSTMVLLTVPEGHLVTYFWVLVIKEFQIQIPKIKFRTSLTIRLTSHAIQTLYFSFVAYKYFCSISEVNELKFGDFVLIIVPFFLNCQKCKDIHQLSKLSKRTIFINCA